MVISKIKNNNNITKDFRWTCATRVVVYTRHTIIAWCPKSDVTGVLRTPYGPRTVDTSRVTDGGFFSSKDVLVTTSYARRRSKCVDLCRVRVRGGNSARVCVCASRNKKILNPNGHDTGGKNAQYNNMPLARNFTIRPLLRDLVDKRSRRIFYGARTVRAENRLAIGP